jgi:demethylmenaquinone methyltransferase / 2-methoxy-6-polyprenyl-1,4-benzoquinol methylase
MDEKAARVRDMFGTIAGRYDLLNHLLSFGVDRGWRRQAVRAALERSPKDILDVATGTADLALALKRAAPQARVVGVDFTEAMLVIGRDKAARAGLSVALLPGDGQALDCPDESFDAVTIAYGLRNFSDPAKGLAEFWRVLRPGGRLVVLEFPPPPGGVFGWLFRLYFLRVLPLVAGVISGNRQAYRYLGDSVLNFPAPEVLADMMRQAGFAGVRYRLQTFGVSALHCGDKSRGDTGGDTGGDDAGTAGEPRETDAHRL